MQQIKFGTSGWRGIMAEDFTFDRVRVVSRAIADHLAAAGEGGKGVVVGCDSRFFGDRFTASHNPPEYNGIKFSPGWGGPALPETTADIERRANAMLAAGTLPPTAAAAGAPLLEIDPLPDYCRAVRDKVDLAAIGRSGMTLVANPMFGAGRGYLDRMLKESGVTVRTINDHRDPYFGGFPPDPAAENVADLIAAVRGSDEVTLGLATDGDADRYGIIDRDGSYIEPNYILALLYDYLLRRRGERGDAARSVATSHFIDAVAAHHGYAVRETPVGFKFIGEYIRDNQIVIGGEESAGLTVRGHVPDKDGILACLLVAEMVAVEGRSLKELLADLYRRVGEYHTGRQNLHLTPALEAAYPGKLQNLPTLIGGRRVTEVIKVDGVKLLLEGGGWVLFRKSGTEPVVRVYAEARSSAELAELMVAAVAFVKGEASESKGG